MEKNFYNDFQFDFSQLHEISGDDKMFLNDLLSEIMIQSKTVFKHLIKHYEEGNIQSVACDSHKFKSTIVLFGKNKLLEIINQIELDARIQKKEDLNELIIKGQQLTSSLVRQIQSVLEKEKRS